MKTYARAKIARKLSGMLHNADTVKLSAMAVQAKIERIQRSSMPYKARLAAIQAVSVANVATKEWSV